MSHIATVEVAMKDKPAMTAACKRLGLTPPEAVKDYRFFDGTLVSGQSIKFKEWNYPAVIDASGKAWFDNYNGRWGDIKHFNAFKQAYAVEAAKAKARQQGFSVMEKTLGNGQVQLVCTKG